MTDLTITRLDGPEVLFTHAELACRGSGGGRLAPSFAARLAALRMAWGKPMRVTSCCRSAAHNRAVGGHPNSLHVYDASAHGIDGTCAIDIACPDGLTMRDLLRLALAEGWSVGVAKGFIHLDRRADFGLAPNVVFGYGKGGA